uniref:F-box domain-containing protein n=1 Tax=Oryza barthii TaxID=65489 RepID=A0A0D3FJ09_9ORYZ
MDADEMTLARLPDEVIQDILARLPPRTIVRCLAVCKAWRSAVSAPTFHRALAAHRQAAVVKVTSELAYFGKPWRYCKALLLDTFRGRCSPPWRHHALTWVVGSWDGVVCVDVEYTSRFGPDLDNTQPERREREFVLWNPLTRACATVPPPAPGGDRGVIIGAYAHPATMRFHLLHAAGEAERGLFAATAIRVRRVGDGGAWREVPLLEQQEEEDGHDDANMQLQRRRRTIIFLRMQASQSVSLHGNLHWMVQRGSGSTARLNVLVFDTARERFRLMEAPPWDDSRGGGEGRKAWPCRGSSSCPASASSAPWPSPRRRARWRDVGARRRRLLRRRAGVAQGVVDGVRLSRFAALLPHRDSVVRHDVSFGEASRLLAQNRETLAQPRESLTTPQKLA